MNSGIKISGKQIVALTFSVCLGLFLIIAGCEKEKVLPREFPKLRTMEVSGINTDGALFEGIIEKAGSEEIIDWGFVWDINQSPKIETAEYYIERYSSGKNTIHRDVLSTLIAGENYFVRFFARTASYVVYGNEVVFESLGSRGPEISSFTPEIGLVGTRVIISGTGFSHRADSNIVKFDHTKALVLEVSDTVLAVVVPSELSQKESFISVTNSRKTGVAATKFKIHDMVIKDFNPKTGTTGDTIMITGAYLYSGSATNVLFNTTAGTVIVATDTTIKAVVPELNGGPQVQLSVTSGNFGIVATEKFQLTTPQITGLSPATAKIGEAVTIKGTNFSNVPEANKVLIDSLECEVLSSSKTQMQIIVPSPKPGWIPIPSTPQKPSELKVLVSEIPSNLNKSFTYLTPSISSLSPATGTFGDILTLNGTNFSKFAEEFKLYLSNTPLEILSLTNEKIVFKLPDGIESASINIKVYTDKFEGDYIFELLPPVVTSVTPAAVTFGDEITIEGNNFNPDALKNYVTVNDYEAHVVSGSRKQLRVKIPEGFTPYNSKLFLKIKVNEGLPTYDFLNLLTIKAPVITGVDPQSTTWGGMISINGQNFSPNLYSVVVRMNSAVANIISASKNNITAEIPNSLITNSGTVDITVDISGGSGIIYTTKANAFSLAPPEIYSISPTVIDNLNQRVTLTGVNFNPEIQYSAISYHNLPTNIIEASPTRIVFEIDFSQEYGENVQVDIDEPVGLACGGRTVFSAQKLNVFKEGAWRKLASFPGKLRRDYAAFSIQGKGYMVGGYEFPTNKVLDEVWQFDPQTNSWKQMSNFPGGAGVYQKYFIANDKAYVGMALVQSNNSQEMWRYEPNSDTWTRMADFPTGSRWFPFIFGIDKKGYVGSGYGENGPVLYDDFWEYNTITNQWTRKNDISILAGYESSNSAGSAVLNGIGYVMNMTFNSVPGHQYRILKYDHINDTWQKVIDTESLGGERSVVINNKWYLLHRQDYSNLVFNVFDPYNSDLITTLPPPNMLVDGGGAFSIGNLGYFLKDWSQDYIQTIWEFDPSKLP